MTDAPALEAPALDAPKADVPPWRDERLHPAVRRALGKDARYVVPRGARVTLSRRHDRPVLFVTNNMDDRIHATQKEGAFYERAELDLLARHMPQGGTFMDAGANIGNHSLYMLLFGGAARVVPVEPNPAAIALYLAAMQINGLLDRVALDTLGYGLGVAGAGTFAVHAPKGNLGWAKLRASDDAEGVEVRAGDDLLAGRRIDVLKMDVEGMEMEALAGLAETVRRDRPVLFVEVGTRNAEAFRALMDDWDYEVGEAFAERKVNQNFLMVPRGGREDMDGKDAEC
jgi:FkbM family methyltransferase